MSLGTAAAVGTSVAATMGNISKAVTASTKAALREVGKLAKTDLTASGRAVFPPMRYRNMGGVRLTVKARTSAEMVTISPGGPWGMLEPGAKPHRGDAWHRGTRMHPGSRDTGAWSRGQETLFDTLGEQVPRQIGDAVEEAFRG